MQQLQTKPKPPTLLSPPAVYVRSIADQDGDGDADFTYNDDGSLTVTHLDIKVMKKRDPNGDPRENDEHYGWLTIIVPVRIPADALKLEEGND